MEYEHLNQFQIELNVKKVKTTKNYRETLNECRLILISKKWNQENYIA